MDEPYSPIPREAVELPRKSQRFGRTRKRRFRRWLAENYRLIYGLVLIATYASLMLYLASLVLLGRSNLTARILLMLLSVCGAISAIPFYPHGGAKLFDGDYVQKLILFHRSKKIERIEIAVASILWSVIGLALFLLFVYPRFQ